MNTKNSRKVAAAKAPTDPLRIMKRSEVAALFGVSLIRVDQLAAKGILRKVKLEGLARSLGFVAEEVYMTLANRPKGVVKCA